MKCSLALVCLLLFLGLAIYKSTHKHTLVVGDFKMKQKAKSKNMKHEVNYPKILNYKNTVATCRQFLYNFNNIVCVIIGL
jgi:hypothetical protein